MLILALFISLAQAAPSAQEQDWGVWQEARSYYDGGKYEEALHALRSRPATTAAYFYNLGNVHYRLNQYGAAVSYFEKANRLKAHDPEIRRNLEISREMLGKVLGKERLDLASSPLESFADGLPLDEVRGVIGLFSFALSLAWIQSFRRTRSLRKTLVQPTGALGVAALLLLAALYGIQRLGQHYPPAACLDAQTIRSGPGDQYLELARLEPGMKIRLLGPNSTGSTESWLQVRYSQEGIGWVRSSSLLLL